MKKVPILMYHSISDDDYFLSVPVRAFDLQMNLLHKLGFSTIDFENIEPENNKKIIITFDDGYRDNFINAMPILKKYNFTATCFVVSNKINSHNDWDADHSRYFQKPIMSKDQISQWLSNDFSIGSHTSNHSNLNTINEKSLIGEILDSQKQLTNLFNIPIKTFSYPYGQFSKVSYDIVKCNFDYAVTTIRSRYNSSIHDKHLLPRVPVNKNTSILKFAIKVLTFYEDFKYKNTLNI